MLSPDSTAGIPPVVPPVLPIPPQWEYFSHAITPEGTFITGGVNTDQLNTLLNAYGAQGWELVSTFVTAYAEGGTHHIVLIFKRPSKLK